jgi:hypothetical protein
MVFLDKDKTKDNVQTHNICTNVPSSQSLRSYRNYSVSIPDKVIGFFNLPNPSSRTMALGSTQPLTGIFLENKGRRARKADDLTAISEPIV